MKHIPYGYRIENGAAETLPRECRKDAAEYEISWG